MFTFSFFTTALLSSNVMVEKCSSSSTITRSVLQRNTYNNESWMTISHKPKTLVTTILGQTGHNSVNILLRIIKLVPAVGRLR